MNFKSLSLSAMLAGTATAIVVVAPAQAASISGETLGFVGDAELVDSDVAIGGLSQLNFFEFGSSGSGIEAIIGRTSSGVFGAAGSGFSVGDLALKKTGTDTWELSGGAVGNWLSGLDNGLNFELNTFNLKKINSFFAADIEGIFRPANLDGTGGFTSQGELEFDGTTFSANITAGEEIPTPALLPGLVGMGVAALRRRKSEEGETAEA